MFQFGGFPSYTYFVQYMIIQVCCMEFPHSEICGYCAYLQLPAAYRSLSRPSSAPDAKAFSLCSFLLELSSSLREFRKSVVFFVRYYCSFPFLFQKD